MQPCCLVHNAKEAAVSRLACWSPCWPAAVPWPLQSRRAYPDPPSSSLEGEAQRGGQGRPFERV